VTCPYPPHAPREQAYEWKYCDCAGNDDCKEAGFTEFPQVFTQTVEDGISPFFGELTFESFKAFHAFRSTAITSDKVVPFTTGADAIALARKTPVLLKLFEEWCPHCKKMKKHFQVQSLTLPQYQYHHHPPTHPPRATPLLHNILMHRSLDKKHLRVVRPLPQWPPLALSSQHPAPSHSHSPQSTARPRAPQALSNEVDGDAVKCMEIECSKSEESKDFCKRVGSTGYPTVKVSPDNVHSTRVCSTLYTSNAPPHTRARHRHIARHSRRYP
jgi:glutaredoxin